MTRAVECPSCRIAPAPDSTLCPDCGEDLGALIHLELRSSVFYNEALALAHSGDDAAALGRLQLALREDSSDVEALLLLGKLHARAGCGDDARQAWQAALRLAPGDSTIVQAMAALAERERATADRLRQAADEERTRQAALARVAQVQQRQAKQMYFAAGAATLGVVVAVWSRWSEPASPAAGSGAAAVSQVAPGASTPAGPAASAASPSTAGAPVPAGATPSGDEAALALRVEEALRQQAALAQIPLRLTVDRGVVAVEGKARSLLQRYLVESTVRSVQGVDRVDLGKLALEDAYVVRSGDTLSSIAARRYGTTSQWPVLAQTNGIAAPYLLRTGQRLSLP